MFFARSQNLMTRRAVIGNGLAVGAGMVAIMAAEAAGRVVVPKIVWVRAPGHVHVGKDVAQVNIRDLLRSLLHIAAPCAIDLRVVGLIKSGDLARDRLLGYRTGGVIHLEHLNGFFSDVGKIGADPPDRHLLVHRVFRQIGYVGRPVVAIQAIHHAMLTPV